jgi:hypothetical protein
MLVNTVTNPEESAKHYAGDDTHFAQKDEKKENIDPYRRKFINVVVRQENELDDDLEEFYYELEPIIKNYDSGEAQSKVSPIIKNFFLVTFAGLILKHNISSARINGDWQIKQVNDKYNGEYDQEAKKAVQDTTSTIGNTLFYRKSPFSGITVGSQITTLQGSTLNSVRNIIRTGVEEGISADKLANNLKNYILRPKDQSKWVSPFDYFRQAFGTKRKPSNIYAGSVEYNCKRIARTEINNTWREATLRANRDQPWVKGYNWVLSKSHPVRDICFPRDTEVLTREGNVKIQDIVVGDYVATHKNRYRKVLKTYETLAINRETTFFVVGGNNLTATSNHPVFINGEWSRADTIKKGDFCKVLILPKGDLVTADVWYVKPGFIEAGLVYNLEVEEDNTYFANNILVHNCDDWAAGSPYTYDEIKTFSHPMCMCRVEVEFKDK